ncbi:MAG: hypothetical protein AAF614_33185 [Chloroflexota bacterium]
MDRTRIVFTGILVLALIVIATLFFTQNRSQTVTGLVGSEKLPFFQDERVQAVFAQNGLQVEVQKAGSREIATRFDLAKSNLAEQDFAFPAGSPAAAKIQRDHGVGQVYRPFFTPMTIATWEPIAELLVAEGIATNRGGSYQVDLAALLTLIENDTRWNELPSNTTFPANTSILITSTDVRKSNSAAMYLALASYVVNDNNILTSSAAAQPHLSALGNLFLRQGFQQNSSQEPFNDYLVKGMGHSPLVMIYEAQFIAQAVQQPGTISSEMVLLYPDPILFTEHVLVPLTDNGRLVGELLETDPTLQELANEYGLRNSNSANFQRITASHNLAIPDNFVNVISPPDYELLENMIKTIEQSYQ